MKKFNHSLRKSNHNSNYGHKSADSIRSGLVSCNVFRSLVSKYLNIFSDKNIRDTEKETADFNSPSRNSAKIALFSNLMFSLGTARLRTLPQHVPKMAARDTQSSPSMSLYRTANYVSPTPLSTETSGFITKFKRYFRSKKSAEEKCPRFASISRYAILR